jgi:F-type H+-transporting ATPase subunit epsilon
MSAKISLDIITQEKPLLSTTVDQLTAPAVMGEVTILPGHIPLFTRLNDGVIRYKTESTITEIAIIGGFMDVGPQNKITIMADSAINAEDIDEQKAELARQKAEDAMKNKQSEVEFKIAEASLRKALLELKVARRRRPRT